MLEGLTYAVLTILSMLVVGWIVARFLFMVLSLLVPVEDKRPPALTSIAWTRQLRPFFSGTQGVKVYNFVAAGIFAAMLIASWALLGEQLYRWSWFGGGARAVVALIAASWLGSMFGSYLRGDEEADKKIANRIAWVQTIGYCLVVIGTYVLWWQAWGVLNDAWGAHDWLENTKNAVVASGAASPLLVWFDWFKGDDPLFVTLEAERALRYLDNEPKNKRKQGG